MSQPPVPPIRETLPDEQRVPAGGDGQGLIGQRFGRFEVLRELGGGAMGWTFVARDPDRQKPVVLKLPAGGRLAPEAVRRRFQQEIQTNLKVTHANVPTV